MQLNSEYFKLIMERVVGVGFKRVIEAEKLVTKGEQPIWELEQACLAWWLSLTNLQDLFSNLSLTSEELSWCKLAINNHRSTACGMIEKKIGFNPILKRGTIPSNGWSDYKLERVTETKGKLYDVK